MLLKNAKIFTMEDEPPFDGCIRIENGIITDIGCMADGDEQVIDAEGCWVLPGLVDAHTHLGLFEDSIGFEGEDGNEDTDPVTPQLRVIDAINPFERSFDEALRAGVTSCVVSPGSANPIAGQIAAIKTYGRRIDDMILKAPCAMKFALGENPKSCYHDKDETPVTRMATAALIREALYQAAEYGRKKRSAEEESDQPDYDAKHEALLPVLDRRIQAHFHAHRADDIFTALRIAKEFSLDAVILHGTEAYL
ncbi:MAG: amidohydrolase, partial [Butyricicoccaceae bacterium]